LSKLAFLLCDRSTDRRGVFGEGSETGTAAERQNSIFFGDGQSPGAKAESQSSATDLLRSGSLAQRTEAMLGEEGVWRGRAEEGKPGARCSAAMGTRKRWRRRGVQEQVFWEERRVETPSAAGAARKGGTGKGFPDAREEKKHTERTAVNWTRPGRGRKASDRGEERRGWLSAGAGGGWAISRVGMI
jgi:hypothetical protein